jgi:DHA1 family bicyclomycin/chloramphenicol resistance-like MFS transporter
VPQRSLSPSLRSTVVEAAGKITMPDRHLPSRRFVVVFCGLALALNAFSCDMLLPTFFAIQSELGAPIERVQAVIPVFLMAAGLGQVIFGPLSDRFGRKPVMAVGLVLYVAGATAALLAPGIGTLLFSRAIQGLGSSCGIVVARAVLRDLATEGDLARTVASTMTIFALGPIVAPLIGVVLLTFGGWRGAFACMASVGAILLALLLLRMSETNRHPDPKALEWERLKASTATVLTNPQSRHFLLCGALLSFMIVSLVSNSPRVFKSAFGIEGALYAALFATTAAGIILGQIINGRVIARLGVITATRRGAVVLTIVNTALALFALVGGMGVVTFTILLVLFNASFLVVLSNSMSLVLEPHRKIAGLASSLFGFLTQLSGSMLALILLPAVQGDLVRWSVVQLLATLATLALIFTYRPRPTQLIEEQAPGLPSSGSG